MLLSASRNADLIEKNKTKIVKVSLKKNGTIL